MALSGSLRLSLALYCSPNLLTKPLLGSQGPCSAYKVLARLAASLLRYSTLSSPAGNSRDSAESGNFFETGDFGEIGDSVESVDSGYSVESFESNDLGGSGYLGDLCDLDESGHLGFDW